MAKPKFVVGEQVEEFATGNTYFVASWNGKTFGCIRMDYGAFISDKTGRKAGEFFIAGTEREFKPSELKWKDAS